MINGWVNLFIMLLLTSCASATPYERADTEDGFWEGYSDLRLTKKSYQVSFTGSEISEQKRINDFSLLRAAELAHQHGYSYFKVLNTQSSIISKSISIQSYIPEPIYYAPTIMCATTRSNGSIQTMPMSASHFQKMPANHFMINSNSNTPIPNFEGSNDNYTLTIPKTIITIEFSDKDLQDSSIIYNVRKTINSLSQKYNLIL